MNADRRLVDLGLERLRELTDVHTFEERGIVMHYDSATFAWWVIDEAELETLGELIEAETPDAYSHWCSGCPATAVDPVRVVRDYDADETTDLDALMHEAGATDDMISYMALRFLRDEVEAAIGGAI